MERDLPAVVERACDADLPAVFQAQPAAHVLKAMLSPANGGERGAGQDGRGNGIENTPPDDRRDVDRRAGQRDRRSAAELASRDPVGEPLIRLRDQPLDLCGEFNAPGLVCEQFKGLLVGQFLAGGLERFGQRRHRRGQRIGHGIGFVATDGRPRLAGRSSGPGAQRVPPPPTTPG